MVEMYSKIVYLTNNLKFIEFETATCMGVALKSLFDYKYNAQQVSPGGEQGTSGLLIAPTPRLPFTGGQATRPRRRSGRVGGQRPHLVGSMDPPKGTSKKGSHLAVEVMLPSMVVLNPHSFV